MEQQPPPPQPQTERSSPPPPPPQQQQTPPPPSLTPTPPPSSASTTSAASLPSPASSLSPPSTPASSSTNPTLIPSTSTSITPTSQNPQLRPASESPSSSFTSSRQQPSPFQQLTRPPSSSLAAPPPPKGGLAIGIPAHQPGPSPPPASFSSLAPPSFGQQFGGLGRGGPDSLPTSSSAQGRQPVQGMQGIGITGSLGSSMPMRPAGVPLQPVRSITASLRQQSVPNSMSSSSQNFQPHGMLRSPNPPSTSQSPQSQNQAWLSPGVQGKPPLPPPSLRPQFNPQSLQLRSHIRPQHHHSVPNSQQQQYTSSAQQTQPSTTNQSQENVGPGQQIQSPRIQQPFSNQQLIARGHGLGIQRPSSHAVPQSGPLSKTGAAETEEPCNRILSKRSIQELVTQIDPSEKLDSEVEDILVDIADEFVESLTTFGCSLAKHRKSSTLEAKDILLHAERNWNIAIPGFSGDEIRTYKKPFTTDIHRERLAAIKRSIVAAKTTNSKSSGGQGGNTKTQFGKGASNILTSPNAKT